MAQVLLEDMHFYAYHGCFKEEKIVGNDFLINVSLEADSSLAEKTDQVTDAVDYQKVYDITKEVCMGNKFNLIEKLGRTICDQVKKAFPQISSIEVKIAKMNPPLGGQVKASSVVIKG